MFGSTPSDVTQSMGPSVDNSNVTYGDHSTALENLGTAFNAGRYPGEVGRYDMLYDEMQKRSAQVEQLTGERSIPWMADPHIVAGVNGQEVPPEVSSMYSYSKQLDEEKRLDALRQQGMPIPTYQNMVDSVNQQVNEIQREASDVSLRSPGFISGWLPRTLGGVASGLTPQNPLLLASSFVGGPEIGGIAGRIASAGLTNGAVSLAGSFGPERAQEQAFGQQFDPSAAWKSAGYAALLGMGVHGISEGVRFASPAISRNTPQQLAETNANLDAIKSNTGPAADLAQGLTTAKTPEEAVGVAAGAPVSALADTMGQVDQTPTASLRGTLQGAEHEILAEGSQPEGMTWNDHTSRLQTIKDAVETGGPLPNFSPVETARTPMDDLLDSMRQGNVSREASEPSLLKFLADQGGIKDDAGELAAMDADKWHMGKPFQRKLVRDDGMSMDDAGLAAMEAGYFSSRSERPTVQDLLDKVDQELKGNKVYPDDHEEAPDSRIAKQMQQFLDENGLDLKQHTNEQIKDAVDAAHTMPPDAPLPQSTGDQGIGAREEADIERELEELRQGSQKMEAAKPMLKEGAADALAPEEKNELLSKFGHYDLDEVVPLGEISLDENGQMVGKGVTLRELLEDIDNDHDLLKAMTTCMRG